MLEQFSTESRGLLWVFFPCSVIGPENQSRVSSQPIKRRTNATRDLHTRVFLRFWQFACY